MFCWNCGKEIDDHAKFCPYCGKPGKRPSGQLGQREGEGMIQQEGAEGRSAGMQSKQRSNAEQSMHAGQLKKTAGKFGWMVVVLFVAAATMVVWGVTRKAKTADLQVVETASEGTLGGTENEPTGEAALEEVQTEEDGAEEADVENPADESEKVTELLETDTTATESLPEEEMEASPDTELEAFMARMPEEIGVVDEEDVAWLLPNSNRIYYTEDMIAERLNEKGLRMACNEIYARKGRKFNSEEARTYFESMAWYQPVFEAEEFDAMGDCIFNEFELANRALILKLEAAWKAGRSE